MLPTDNTKNTNFFIKTTEGAKEHKKNKFRDIREIRWQKKKFRDIRAIRWQNKNNPLIKEKLRVVRAIRWQNKNNPLTKEKTSCPSCYPLAKNKNKKSVVTWKKLSAF